MKLSTEIEKRPSGFFWLHVYAYGADRLDPPMGTLLCANRRQANEISKLLRAVPPKPTRKKR